MRSSFFVLCLLPIFANASPDIQNWETEQGSKVFFVETHELPMVDIKLIFDAGSSRDGDKPGLAVMTNQLLSEGAAGKSVDEISRAFESLGAIYSSNTGYDSASIGVRSLSDKEKLKLALANLQSVLSQPDFPESGFERERKRLLIGIQAKKQSPSAIAEEAFYAALYGDHPYARPTEGNEDSLQNLTVVDLENFHKKHYVANDTVIAIVGDLTRERAELIVKTLTSKLTVGESLPAIPQVTPLKKAEEVFVEHPSGQMHILIGQPGVKRGDADYFPLYLGNHVLGGGGMVSRLFSEVREKRGLSYSVYSYFAPMREVGPFIAGLSTRADQVDEAIAVLKENIHDFIESGPTEDELIASKKNITGGFPLRIDNNGKILSYLSVIGFYGLPLDYLNTFNANIEAVTVEQVKDAFRRRLQPEKFATVKVGPSLAEETSN